jgi:glycosyltransferase involved in cell wall biosynthesis
MMIKTFLETFKNKKQRPGLILKTSSATSSVMDREEMLNKIRAIQSQVTGDLPSVYLLHGELLDEEMNDLYNHPKVKAFVSFTKGEGYGRPLLESTISQKPVIASNWSGHLDYLSPNMSILLPGAVNQIHPSAVVPNMLIAESGWFTVDYKQASIILKDVYNNYKKYVDRAKKQSYRSRTEFNLDKMGELLINILDKNVPKPLELKLPILKKIG